MWEICEWREVSGCELLFFFCVLYFVAKVPGHRQWLKLLESKLNFIEGQNLNYRLWVQNCQSQVKFEGLNL
jgi:hypothetical protein